MRKILKAGVALGALSLLVAAVASGSAEGQAQAKDTLVFATEGEPTFLDPAIVSDGPSLRVADQITEGLVTVKPGTTKIVPDLATSWTGSNGGKRWTFKLRGGVKFHDGTPFNAQAVCANFNRWYNFPAAFQPDSVAYYYYTVFGGYRKPAQGITSDPLFSSCQVVNASTARINLRKPSASFIAALSLPSLSMQSPTALKKYKANAGTLSADGVLRPSGTYATEHPTGTGPYKFKSWKIGDKLVLERNDSYWGKKAKLKQVILRAIPDNAARLQALQSGEIDGYNLVEPQDISTIKRNSSLKIIDRPAFNVGYVTINSAKAPMNKLLVRQAVAHGLDREAVVKSFYGGRAQVATQFMPPQLFGWAKDVKKYPYNPARSRQLLQQAGLTLPVEIEFWYPTDISRGYMPDPQRNFQAFAASLENSGFKVVAKSAPWRPDYVARVQAGNAGHLNLIGWTGDFGDPDNFIGTFFRTPQNTWGPINPKIHAILNAALRETDLEKRTLTYQQANRLIMANLPGVPYVHTKPALAFKKSVRGYVASPIELEPFAPVSK
ncbi:MAG: ABC transporter substrate-binding protein [Actinobacteria bacterium]|nr:ABC transporter substrate-binding protein [Actinomycetota bacterium]